VAERAFDGIMRQLYPFVLPLNHLEQVRSHRQVLRRNRASNQSLAGMSNLPLALILMGISVFLQHGPNFLQGTAAQFLEQRVGYFRPAVLEPFLWILRRAREYLFAAESDQLCAHRGAEPEHEQDKKNASSAGHFDSSNVTFIRAWVPAI
jgi:hypothetical protein